VLSKFAGAAEELETALSVISAMNRQMARTIATALSMPRSERRMRWSDETKLRGPTPSSSWFADFIDAPAGHAIDEARSNRSRRNRRRHGALRAIQTAARAIINSNRDAIEHRAARLRGFFDRIPWSTRPCLPTNTRRRKHRLFVADDDARIGAGEARSVPSGR